MSAAQADETQPPVKGHDRMTPRAPWADGPLPDARLYMESECFVAGALSTYPPFDKYHPYEALPFARVALDALGRWEPTDAESGSEQPDDLLYEAWTVIANAGGGDWTTTQSDEWVEAAVRWRDRFHAHIGSSGGSDG